MTTSLHIFSLLNSELYLMIFFQYSYKLAVIVFCTPHMFDVVLCLSSVRCGEHQESRVSEWEPSLHEGTFHTLQPIPLYKHVQRLT